MSKNDQFIIEMPPAMNIEGYFPGPWFDMLTGEEIIGPYCQWPKPLRKEHEGVLIILGKDNAKAKIERYEATYLAGATALLSSTDRSPS